MNQVGTETQLSEERKKNIRLVILKFHHKTLPFALNLILILDGTNFEESTDLIG